MDELQISGKRFISSRRAARDNGYTPDYIGQLIRAGKVRGQKVGRAWYVEADSFAAYLSNEPVAAASAHSVEAPPQAAEESPVAEIAAEVEEKEEPAPVEEKKQAPIVVRIEEKQPEPIVITEEKPVTPDAVKEIPEEADAPVIVKIRKAKQEGGLTYVSSEEAFLPKVAPRAVTSVMPREEATRSEEAVVEPRSRGYWGEAALAAFGLAVFVVSAVLGSSMAATLHLEEGNPASAGYSIDW